MKKLILQLSIIAFSAFLAGAADLPSLPSESLYKLDTGKIAIQTGEDRILKYLMKNVSRDDEHFLINTRKLDAAIVQSIESGDAMAKIATDLGKGDDKLRTAIIKMLYTFNFPSNQTMGFINEWSKNGASADMRAIFNSAKERPEAIAELRNYLLTADSDYVKFVDGVFRIIVNDDKFSLSAMRQSMLNVMKISPKNLDLQMAAAKEGDLEQLSFLVSNSSRIIDANGALVQLLLNVPTIDSSWYETTWKSCISQIANDPLLVNEYAQRSNAIEELFQTMRILFADSFEGSKTLEAYIKASTIPGSRYALTVDKMLEKDGGLSIYNKAQKDRRASLETLTASKIVTAIKTDQDWAKWFLWHLTRVGEAQVMTIRQGISSVLDGDEELSIKMISNSPALGSQFENMLTEDGAYSYYEGKASELRDRVSKNNFEQEAIKKYTTSVGKLLQTNDEAWNAALSYGTTSPKFMALILQKSMERDSNVTAGWIKTIYQNNELLKVKFGEWLIKTKRAQDSFVYDKWLVAIVSAVQNGSLIGNTDISNFKQWFGEFMSLPDGYRPVFVHLATESSEIPYKFRQAMIDLCNKKPERFWRLYTILNSTKGYSTTTLQPKLEDFVANSKLSEYLLDEVIAQNPFAADAAAILWDNIVINGTLIENIKTDMSKGQVLSNAFSLGNLVLLNQLKDDEIWDQVKEYGSILFPELPASAPDLRDKIRAKMLDKAGECTKFFETVLSDQWIFKKWRQQILIEIKFLGKAYITGAIVKKDNAILLLWKQEMLNKVKENPLILRSMVDCLGARRVGDPEWQKTIVLLKGRLTKIVFEDRILFEQLLNDPSLDFKRTLLEEVGKQFNQYTSQQWAN